MNKKKITLSAHFKKLFLTITKPLQKLFFSNSSEYWKNRYRKGGNSGSGSFGKLAEYKASFLNDFAMINNIKQVIEFGCGNGQQSKLYQFNRYIGLDVSESAITQSIKEFENSNEHAFFVYNSMAFSDRVEVFKSDLAISIDVIYHLIEDEIYNKYIEDLFNSSYQWVVIYSSNTLEPTSLPHVKHRLFQEDIKLKFPDWEFIRQEANPVYQNTEQLETAHACFFIYKKITANNSQINMQNHN